MKRVLAFGSFDSLHEGHKFFLSSAAKLGDALTVVVASDAYIASVKKNSPEFAQTERMRAVKGLDYVSEVLPGEEPGSYTLLQTLPFDVLAVGYDQQPADEEIKKLLVSAGKEHVQLKRIPPHHPEKYKSSLLRAA